MTKHNLRTCKLERDIESLQKSWISPRLEPENCLKFREELQQAIFYYNVGNYPATKMHTANAMKLLRKDEPEIPEC